MHIRTADTDVARYNFEARPPTLEIFGRNALLYFIYLINSQLRKMIHTYIHIYIHTNLYSTKNRENESEALAQDDQTVKADWKRWNFRWRLKVYASAC